MKTVKIALAILAVTVLSVLINSFVLSSVIKKYEKEVSKIDSNKIESAFESYSAIYDNFNKEKDYISLTVNHEDLTNIEDNFAAAIGAARSHDESELEITKSRLLDALGHLRRLVGINLDSIL